MLTVFTCTRYVIFALSIACNAIIASIAVWNLGFVQSLKSYYPLDNYLTFLGAFGLALVFVIVSVELVRDNSIVGRLWFECLWIGVLFVMNLVGAAYLSANPPSLCDTRARLLLGFQACTSNQVLLAFTWIMTVVMFWYLAVLVIYCLVGRGKWQANIKDLSNPQCFRVISPTRPTSPAILPYFHKRKTNTSIIAPKPHRPIPPVDAISGLRSLYDIEPYQPPQESNRSRLAMTEIPMLYSQHVQSVLPAPPSARTRAARKAPPSPPPLGNWPRADILTQPVRKWHNSPPSPVDVLQNVTLEQPDGSSPLSPSRTRPFGPRTPNTKSRPPPLDLGNGTSTRPKGKAPVRNWDS